MPGFDGTGPMGQGPMTGGGFGNCVTGAGVPARRFGGTFFGRGLGRGQRAGGGRGWRNWFRATGLTGWQRAAGAAGVAGGQPPLDALKQQAEELADVLKDMQSRIQDIESQKKE